MTQFSNSNSRYEIGDIQKRCWGNLELQVGFCDEISNVAKILDDCFQITFFHFIRIYDDGTLISLSNEEYASKYCCEHKYYLDPRCDKIHPITQSCIHPWASFVDQEIILWLREKLGLGIGVTFVEKFKTYKECFCFGEGFNTYNIYNICMNKKEILKDFAIFFKAENRGIIKKCESKRLYCLEGKETTNLNDTYNFDLFFDRLRKEKLNKNNHSIVINESMHITKRELEVIVWIMKGKTSEETGIILKINKRTVESHILSLKIKFNCYKTSELIYKILGCGLSFDNYV